jgi:hypothetical protein
MSYKLNDYYENHAYPRCYLPGETELRLDTSMKLRPSASKPSLEHEVLSPLPVVSAILKPVEPPTALKTL